MAEVLVEYTDVVLRAGDVSYVARACGAPTDSGLWHGWLEFIGGDGRVVVSGRETTQPNRTDTVYWATGLTAVYLEGALERALHPLQRSAPHREQPRAHAHAHAPDVPAPAYDPPPAESILNPFSVYRKGEALLRRQLAALSVWHLVNIVRDHELDARSSSALNALSADALIEIVVAGVKARNAEAVPR